MALLSKADVATTKRAGGDNLALTPLSRKTNKKPKGEIAERQQDKLALSSALTGQVATATNFKTDINVNGVINASDISTVKSRSGTALP